MSHIIEKNDIKTRRVFINNCILQNTKLGTKRILPYIFFAVHRSLYDTVYLTVNDLVEWFDYKPNTHKGKINDNIKELLMKFEEYDYCSYKRSLENSVTSIVKLNKNYFVDNDNFALLYLDEILKIIHHKRVLISLNEEVITEKVEIILLVFSYLRKNIMRRSVIMDSETDIIRNPETLLKYYSEIAGYLSINERAVSKSIEILSKLKLIHFEILPRYQKSNKWYTNRVIFVNYYKRYNLKGIMYEISGKEYYQKEIENKKKQLDKISLTERRK